MTEPVITLPNGDTIRVGEYGFTSDGRVVGPILVFRDYRIFHIDGTNDRWLAGGEGAGNPSIISKWNPVEAGPDPVKPPKRDLRTIDDHELFGELDERTQKRLRKADKRGWPVQWFDGVVWEACRPSFHSYFAYRLDPAFTPPAKRVKPAPKVETFTQDMWQDAFGNLCSFASARGGHPVTITFTRTNGEIDNDSYKVEVKP